MSDDTFALEDKKCYAGYYCPNLGTATTVTTPAAGATPATVATTVVAAALGNTVPNAVICPKGHYCLTGSATPTICDAGFYEPR